MTTVKLWAGTRVLAVLAVAFLAVPVVALLTRVPWADLGSVLSSPQTLQAVAVSLGSSLTAALLCVKFGTSLALWLATLSGVAATLVRVCVVVPLVMPPVVGGVALLAAFDSTGLVGPAFSVVGITLPRTFAAIVLAQAFVALPFMVITVEASLRSGVSQFAQVGTDLGASSWTVFRRVTLPLLRPAIVAGGLLCLARALGEFGATSLFGGNVAGSSQTLTQVVMTYFQGTAPAASAGYALAGILVLMAMLIVVLAGLWRDPGRSNREVHHAV